MVTKSLIGEVGVTRSIVPRRDGLVLWLPLYRLQGGSIYSEEGQRHLCTVIGAIWGSQGRILDGDDKITANTVAAGGFFGGAHTLIGWAKLAAWADNMEIAAASKSDLTAYSFIGYDGALKKFTCHTCKTAAENIVNSSGTYNNDTSWHFVAATIDADGHINHFIVDDVDMGSKSTFTNDLSVIDEFRVGSLYAATNYWRGTGGEVMVYNRELTVTEIAYIRTQTQRTYKACWGFFTWG